MVVSEIEWPRADKEPELADVTQQRHEILRAKGATIKTINAFNIWESKDYPEFGMAYFPGIHQISASQMSFAPWQALGWNTDDFRNTCFSWMMTQLPNCIVAIMAGSDFDMKARPHSTHVIRVAWPYYDLPVHHIKGPAGYTDATSTLPGAEFGDRRLAIGVPPRYSQMVTDCERIVDGKVCIDMFLLMVSVARHDKVVLLGERNCELSITLVNYIQEPGRYADIIPADVAKDSSFMLASESRYHYADPNSAYTPREFIEYARLHHGTEFPFWAARMYSDSWASGHPPAMSG